MEVYTFIHKETKQVIKVDYYNGADAEFDCKYYLTDRKYGIPWFVFNQSEIDFLIENKDFVHPQYSMVYNAPSLEYINLDDYEIATFKYENI